MRQVAYIGIMFDPKQEIIQFSLNLPSNSTPLSCRRLLKSKKNFLQLCYCYNVKNLDDEIINWKKFDFFIVSKDLIDFDTTGLKLINNIKVNLAEFNVYYKI